MPQIVPILILGLAAGMAVNYLADILPITRRIGPPVCIHCGREQAVVSYFLWPRRCHNCLKRRGARTWIVETAYPLLFLWLYLSPQAGLFLPFWAAAVLWVFFGVVIVIDAELRLILHPVSLAGALLCFALGVWLNGFPRTMIGGFAGYGVMFALFGLGALFNRLVRRLQGENEEVALGFGDVNLSGVLGLLLGWPNILMGLVISVMIAGVFSAVLILFQLILRRYRAFTAIPYGPFLVLGAAALLFLPDLAQRILVIIGPLFWIAP